MLLHCTDEHLSWICRDPSTCFIPTLPFLPVLVVVISSLGLCARIQCHALVAWRRRLAGCQRATGPVQCAWHKGRFQGSRAEQRPTAWCCVAAICLIGLCAFAGAVCSQAALDVMAVGRAGAATACIELQRQCAHAALAIDCLCSPTQWPPTYLHHAPHCPPPRLTPQSHCLQH